MRKKPILAACLGALALLTGVFYSARVILTRSFATIERDEGHQNIERVKQALRMEVRQLRTSAEDNGQWDQAYDFVQGRRPDFPNENFTRAELDALQVQVAWIGDAAGRTLAALGTRGAAAGAVEPLTPQVVQRLRRVAGLHVVLDNSSAALPLLQLPDGVLVFSAVRITATDRVRTDGGILLYGHYLDEAMINRLAETSQSPVQFLRLESSESPISNVPEAVVRWLNASPDNSDDTLVRPGAGDTLESYTVLRDVQGKRLGILASKASRTALRVGKQTIMWVVVLLLGGFSVIVGLLITLLDRAMRNRAHAQRLWLDQQRKLARIARRDALTGLPNRIHLQKALPRLLKRASKEGTRLALLCIDLDHFKNINDSLGHASGDRLLTAIATRLRASVSSNDLVVRMGGDEFVVVATMLPGAEVVAPIAQRIREALDVSIDVDGVSMFVSPSIGISIYPDHGLDAEQLLKHADIALNHAKDQGRANFQFYTSEMNTRVRERVGLERALRQALENDELSVEYQPCFDLKSLRPVSLEALVRWRTADGTYVPPSRFIPIAEQSGLILDIGDRVLRRVGLQLSEWQRQHVPLLPVSVNISVRQIEQTQLAKTVSLLASELGIDANLLHFEITESAAMHNSQQHLGALQALRNLGSRILIDDFGTGYSNLSYLKHLPIDTLKIDRAFVRDMAVDANDAAIVRAIVAVARSLGLQLVAEGIESQEQLDYLRKLGCECGQGFLFSPPVSAEHCCALLTQRATARGAAEPAKVRFLSPVT